MTPSALATLLAALPEQRIAAIDLLVELAALEQAGGLDVAALAAMQPRLTAAADDLDTQVLAAREVISRCQQLPPVPSNSLPLGF